MHYDVTLMTCKAKEQKAKSLARPDKTFQKKTLVKEAFEQAFKACSDRLKLRSKCSVEALELKAELRVTQLKVP